MPVIKQAIKKVRQDKRKTAINLKVKQALKKAIVAFKKNASEITLRAVFKAADKAAKTNVIHRNKASRIKSRLSKKIKPSAKTPKTTKK